MDFAVSGRSVLGILVLVTRKIAQGFAVVVVSLFLTGCASSLMDGIWGDDNASTGDTSASTLTAGVSPDMTASQDDAQVAKLYNEGLASLADGSNKSAIKQFGEVERQYPYSAFATKSILMQAYAHYRMAKWDDAIIAANRFITLHPGHRDAGYAYYLIAVCQYNKMSNTKRDQTATREAMKALEEVAQRYPGTPYAADAANKVIIARDHLAGKEMEVGRYYLRQGSYLAAINRFKRVITEYRNTSQTPEALYRLTEGYMALGIASEAQTAAAVLAANYPESQWYRDAYNLLRSDGEEPVANEDSWISKAFASVNPF
jgi:outer membrane protein assembly factor BamD